MGVGNRSNANTPEARVDKVNAPLGMKGNTPIDGVFV